MSGAFERYRQAVDPQRVAKMLMGRSAFSRQGPLSAWVVIWLMIFQRLDSLGTLSVAVRELLCGPTRLWVRWRSGETGPELSASTSVGLGDRNFGVFSVAYHFHQEQHPCLLRLTEARARKVNGGVLPNAGTDKPIQWVCSRWDRSSNPELPEQATVEGRLVVVKVFGADGKPQKLYFFTTLDLPADRLTGTPEAGKSGHASGR